MNLCICRSEDLEQILSGCFCSDVAVSEHTTSKLIYCAAVLSRETWSCRGETAALLSF